MAGQYVTSRSRSIQIRPRLCGIGRIRIFPQNANVRRMVPLGVDGC
jgi:hypothetical protein